MTSLGNSKGGPPGLRFKGGLRPWPKLAIQKAGLWTLMKFSKANLVRRVIITKSEMKITSSINRDKNIKANLA